MISQKEGEGMNKVSILGVKFDAITKQEAVQRAMEAIRQEGLCRHAEL